MRVLAALLILLLAGCVSTPHAVRPAQAGQAAFALDGRIAVRYDGQRSSGTFHWQHDPGSDDILMLAPLGVTVAHVMRDAEGATLEASGRRYTAPDSGELMQRALGWRLPLDGLPYWVMALPAPAPATEAQVERGPNGQISQMHQDGWEISYTAYADSSADSLPTRLTLRRDNLEIRLLLDEWKTQ
jgi:outer membrane lipoprotein LolB